MRKTDNIELLDGGRAQLEYIAYVAVASYKVGSSSI